MHGMEGRGRAAGARRPDGDAQQGHVELGAAEPVAVVVEVGRLGRVARHRLGKLVPLARVDIGQHLSAARRELRMSDS